MKLSVGAFSFNNSRIEQKMDSYGYMKTVHEEYGLDTIDFWNAFFADTSRPLWAVANDDTLLGIKAALQERGLTLANIAVDTAQLWHPDEEVREALHQNALSYLHAAELLGARSVRLDAVTHGDEQMSDEACDYIVKRYTEYARRAAEGGYWIGPENHTGFALQADSLIRIAQAVDHPNFGILLHVGRWVDTIPTPSNKRLNPEAIHALAREHDLSVLPWTKHIHIDARTIYSDDAAARIKPLLDAGYDGYWAIEHNAPQDQREAISAALQQMRLHLEQCAGSDARN